MSFDGTWCTSERRVDKHPAIAKGNYNLASRRFLHRQFVQKLVQGEKTADAVAMSCVNACKLADVVCDVIACAKFTWLTTSAIASELLSIRSGNLLSLEVETTFASSWCNYSTCFILNQQERKNLHSNCFEVHK